MSLRGKTKKLTFMGLMLALIVVLISIERMLPPLPMMPPQFGKVGLSNIIVMYMFFFIGKKEAFFIAALKALFNLLLRGPIAALLSLSGGLFSIVIIFILYCVFKNKISYVSLSVAGALGHNIAQLFVACVLMQDWMLFTFYFPILLIAGAIVGTATGMSLKIIIPVFKKIHRG
jgi:heptaprenyl diphosphate synthase